MRWQRIGLLMLFLIAGTINLNAQNVKSGLTGYWPFNGNANDESPNSNHGTVTGAQLTTDRFGNSNSAYFFDGNGDYINIGRDTSLFPSDITLNFWFQYTDTSSNAVLVNNGNSVGGEWGIVTSTIVDGKGLAGSMGAGSNNHSIGHIFYDHYADGQWHMFTLVYSQAKNQEFSIYLDGCFLSHNTTVGSSGGFRSTDQLTFRKVQDWYMGASAQYFSGTQHFGPLYYHGKLDDVGIYNRSLSSTEIQSLFIDEVLIDTTYFYDTTDIYIDDTTTVMDTITFYDTSYTHVYKDTLYKTFYDTAHLVVYDTTLVRDTSKITVFDTMRIVVYDTIRSHVLDTIRYYDTTYIGVTDTIRFGPLPPSQCQIRIYPDRNNDVLFVRSETSCIGQGYSIRILRDPNKLIHQSTITSGLTPINMNKLGSPPGTLTIELRSPGNVIVARKKIVLY